jgi:hypothetical protein
MFMLKMTKNNISLFLILLFPLLSPAQELLPGGQVHGNFQVDAQYYKQDKAIGAIDVPEKVLSNAFANLIYTNGDFNAGLRYESYLNPMLGYDIRYKGSGIPYWFATYKAEIFEVTVGNFYEQFGSGMILRAYEERNLGFDNAFSGIRIKVSAYKGVTLKGLIGKQRFFWDQGPGIVRGFDANLYLNEMLPSLESSKTRIELGGSFVSKYQPSEEIVRTVMLLHDTLSFLSVPPQNVGAFSSRVNISHGRISFSGEYAHKINDPVELNNFIYKPGNALLLTATYSQKGLGMILSTKWMDNMSFKSDRNEKGNFMDINYLPALTKQHVYTLPAMYPYSTQPNGEMAIQAQVNYNIKKNTMMGGAYGTDVAVNFSTINSIVKNPVNDTTAIGEFGTTGYKTKFMAMGDQRYFTDFNIEVLHKFNKRFKGNFSYVNLVYNQDVMKGDRGEPMLYAQIALADMTLKVQKHNAVRMEMQHLWTNQDNRNWALVLLEYDVAGEWFFAASDQYKYEITESDSGLHYYNIAAGYISKANRVQLSYGKQREGIVCVGGVCRQVPASNGFSISITSSF